MTRTRSTGELPLIAPQRRSATGPRRSTLGLLVLFIASVLATYGIRKPTRSTPQTGSVRVRIDGRLAPPPSVSRATDSVPAARRVTHLGDAPDAGLPRTLMPNSLGRPNPVAMALPAPPRAAPAAARPRSANALDAEALPQDKKRPVEYRVNTNDPIIPPQTRGQTLNASGLPRIAPSPEPPAFTFGHARKPTDSADHEALPGPATMQPAVTMPLPVLSAAATRSVESFPSPLKPLNSSQATSSSVVSPTVPHRGSELVVNRSAVARVLDPANATRFPLRFACQQASPLEQIIAAAIQSAPALASQRATVAISAAEVKRQKANFDWTAFLEQEWSSDSNPVDSQLSGAQDRLNETNLDVNLGVRRRNLRGGSIEAAQQYGLRDSNSQFFTPDDQARSQIRLQYQQPLLRNRGRKVTRSVIDIAVLDNRISDADFQQELQNYLLGVIERYWQLAAARGEFYVAKRSLQRSEALLKMIENRQNLDAGAIQLFRARATTRQRQGDVVTREFAVVAAQEQLLRDVYGAYYRKFADCELIPASPFVSARPLVNAETAIAVSYQHRPEIRSAIQSIRRASVTAGVSKNQLLPLLDMTLAISNAGLAGDYELDRSVRDQFGIGPPTLSVGFDFQRPIGNRQAKAAYQQSLLAVERFQKQFEDVSSSVAAEVRIAILNLNRQFQQVQIAADTLELRQQELRALEARTRLLLDGDQVGSLYLDNLLLTQDRLAQAESAYLQAVSEQTRALFQLEKAKGTLLIRPVVVTRRH